MLLDNLIFGLHKDWNCTDTGDAMCYHVDPNQIPAQYLPRIIYELRCDIARLNDEVMELLRKRNEPITNYEWTNNDERVIVSMAFPLLSEEDRIKILNIHELMLPEARKTLIDALATVTSASRSVALRERCIKELTSN